MPNTELIIDQTTDLATFDLARELDACRFFMGQSAEAMLEAGKRLLTIKEHTDHGQFTSLLETELKLDARTARRMMQASLKFSTGLLESKRSTSTVLGKNKLFELLTEDDEDLAELFDGGDIRGIKLDDVQRLTVRELRDELRRTKEEAAAALAAKDETIQRKNKLIDSKTAEVDKLEEALGKKRKEKVKPDEKLASLRLDLSNAGLEATAAVKIRMQKCISDLLDHDNHQREYVAGIVAEVVSEARYLQTLFALNENPTGEQPDWMKAALAPLAGDVEG